MYTISVANSVMLHLQAYIRHDFYNATFKIKQIIYRLRAPPPHTPWKILGARLLATNFTSLNYVKTDSGDFTCIRTVAQSACQALCPPVCLGVTTKLSQDGFQLNLILSLQRKPVEKLRIWLKSGGGKLSSTEDLKTLHSCQWRYIAIKVTQYRAAKIVEEV